VGGDEGEGETPPPLPLVAFGAARGG
jgi:hypothetical protein